MEPWHRRCEPPMKQPGFVILVAIGCLLSVGVGGRGSQPVAVQQCRLWQLAFSFSGPPAPTQTQAVGLEVHNTGGMCRLELPVSLTLAHREGRTLHVSPRTSRLTLVARILRPRGRAWVTWTYANYCGRHNWSDRPVVHIVRVPGIEIREFGGLPPCLNPKRAVALTVLFACPGARGPAIEAILPRPTPLCPR